MIDGGAKGKFFSRMMVVGLLALAFAGCAAMFTQGHSSLFADQTYSPVSDYAAR